MSKTNLDTKKTYNGKIKKNCASNVDNYKILQKR